MANENAAGCELKTVYIYGLKLSINISFFFEYQNVYLFRRIYNCFRPLSSALSFMVPCMNTGTIKKYYLGLEVGLKPVAPPFNTRIV